MPNGVEQPANSLTVMDVVTVVSGVALFAGWLLRTSLGRQSLAGSKPRRNCMMPVTPILLFLAWMFGVGLLQGITARIAGHIEMWRALFLGQLAYSVGSAATVAIVLILAKLDFARGIKGLGLRLRTAPKDLGFAFLHLLAVWPLVLTAMSLTILVTKMRYGPEYRIPQHEALEADLAIPGPAPGGAPDCRGGGGRPDRGGDAVSRPVSDDDPVVYGPALAGDRFDLRPVRHHPRGHEPLAVAVRAGPGPGVRLREKRVAAAVDLHARDVQRDQHRRRLDPGAGSDTMKTRNPIRNSKRSVGSVWSFEYSICFGFGYSNFVRLVLMESKEAKIVVEHGTDVTLVTFEDENILEEPQIHRLERALLPIVRENQDKRLVLNFQNVRFMSSSFLGLLVKIHKRVVEMDGHLQLFNLDPKIRKVFEITQLVKVFDIVPPATE